MDSSDKLDLVQPTPVQPIVNYVGSVQSGTLVFISGQPCIGPTGYPIAVGQIGNQVSVEQAQLAARQCTVNLYSQLNVSLGSPDRVTRVARLTGYINSGPGIAPPSKIMDGASDFMVSTFGEKERHSRTTIGVAALPMDSVVEVDGIFEVMGEQK